MTEGEKRKQVFDREVRDMISALTHRLADLQRHDDDHDQADDNDDHGVKIITLAGSNVGATMRSELDAENSADRRHHHKADVSPGLQEEHEPLTALVNSNFQAINNSLMLGGSYSTNDPGVHMDVSDGGYNNNSTEMEHHHQKRGRKEGKKKAKAKETTTSSKTDYQSQGSDA